MPDIHILSEEVLKAIYSYLSLFDKFQFAVTTKGLYALFSKYLLLNDEMRVEGEDHPMSTFLFQVITRLKVKPLRVSLSYIGSFKNLRIVDISCIAFETFSAVKYLTNHFPNSLVEVLVSDHLVQEQFEAAISLLKRNIVVTIADHKGTSILNNAKRRHMEVPSNNQTVKRMRTPSPVRELVDERIEELLLFRNRMKRAISDPEEFLPNGIFKAFPSICQDYEPLINHSPFTTYMTMDEVNIDAAINKLAELLLHAVVINNNNDWFFVTQVEFYLKNKTIDDVAVTSKYDRFNDKLVTSIEKLQEGKGTWFELRFNVKDIEVLVTGGLSNLSSSSNNNNININAFLGVAAPATLALDDNFLLLAPKNPVEAVRCTRMLRNYKKQASMKDWCFKSSFFTSLGFTTPLPLQLYDNQEENIYVRLGSELLYLSAKKLLTEEKLVAMKVALEKMDKSQKLSKAKRVITELITNTSMPGDQELLLIANGILLPRVKTINGKRVKTMQKRIN